jgi:hypothetical protein
MYCAIRSLLALDMALLCHRWQLLITNARPVADGFVVGIPVNRLASTYEKQAAVLAPQHHFNTHPASKPAIEEYEPHSSRDSAYLDRDRPLPVHARPRTNRRAPTRTPPHTRKDPSPTPRPPAGGDASPVMYLSIVPQAALDGSQPHWLGNRRAANKVCRGGRVTKANPIGWETGAQPIMSARSICSMQYRTSGLPGSSGHGSQPWSSGLLHRGCVRGMLSLSGCAATIQAEN